MNDSRNGMKISRPQYGLQEEIMQTIFILQQKKSSQPFKQPVDTFVYTDYLNKIQKPMDLSTILKNLKNGVYRQAEQVHKDLDLIMSNCIRYNATGDIIKKAHQFGSCIETVWGNFRRQIEKKGINYEHEINITDQILKRLNIIQEKKTRKRVPGLHLAMEKQRKNILPESSILPPIEYQIQRPQKQQMPLNFNFQIQKYLSLTRQQKQKKVCYSMQRSKIKERFDEVSAKKIQKYRKILKKKIMWCQQKIIQKCLQKKKYKKMQIPNHLSSTIQGGKIAQELNIRKIQMYVKQITYWIQDNSNVLGDYMKDKYVECCRSIRKCLFRVIRYKKIPKTQKFVMDNILYSQNLPSINQQRNFENEKEDDSNYQNKMKEFRRMLDKDRGQSTKRDTKIILKNQNGQFQVIDWTSDKGKDRIRKDGGGGIRNDIPDQDEKRKIQQRKKEQMRKDEEFIQDYSKKSNVLLIGKYGNKLRIDWEEVMFKKYEFPTQIPINFQFNKQDLHLN